MYLYRNLDPDLDKLFHRLVAATRDDIYLLKIRSPAPDYLI